MAEKYTREYFAALLERKYGEPNLQDLHIDYFYIRLGKDIIEKEPQILDTLNSTVSKGEEWGEIETNWNGLLIAYFPKLQGETEREREERLSLRVRTAAASILGVTSLNSIPILISRACKYLPKSTKNQLHINTSELKILLENSLSANQHLVFFYLYVQLSHQDAPQLITKALQDKPGNWKLLNQEDCQWSLTFVGYYSGSMFDKSEREREVRLDKEVRQPLKKYLQESTATPNVTIIITRACICSHM